MSLSCYATTPPRTKRSMYNGRASMSGPEHMPLAPGLLLAGRYRIEHLM